MDGATDLRDSKAESANKRDVCFVCFFVSLAVSLGCAFFQMFYRFSQLNTRRPRILPTSIFSLIFLSF